MARTAIVATQLVGTSSALVPAGTTIDPTNNHILTIPRGAAFDEFFFVINATFAGSKNYTIKAGVSPPARNQGQGDLVVALNAVKHRVGPFPSARFMQADGSIHVDVQAGATGTIEAVVMPQAV